MFAVILVALTAQNAAPDREMLIQGIIARSESVFSGEIAYSQEVGFPNGAGMEDRNYQVLFSGSSWRKTFKIPMADFLKAARKHFKHSVDIATVKGDFERIEVSHNGKYVDFKQTPQMDNTIRNSIDIQHSKPLRYASPFPPVFAGSFWYPVTRDFVRNNVAKAIYKGKMNVHGVMCEVLEWDVSAADKYEAFNGTNELTAQGGKLRIYTAPQLGFVIPRYEYVGRNGQVATSFDASEFQEYGDGIFIPRKCSLQDFDSNGPAHRIANTLTSISRINESIPDKDFVVCLCEGTIVSDSRHGDRSIVFTLTKDSPIPPDLEDIVSECKPSFWGWNWQTALIIGGAIGLLALGVYFASRRLLPRRTKR